MNPQGDQRRGPIHGEMKINSRVYVSSGGSRVLNLERASLVWDQTLLAWSRDRAPVEVRGGEASGKKVGLRWSHVTLMFFSVLLLLLLYFKLFF